MEDNRVRYMVRGLLMAATAAFCIHWWGLWQSHIALASFSGPACQIPERIAAQD